MNKYNRKFTYSKNGLTKQIQEAIIRLDFKLNDEEICGTVTREINELTEMLVNDNLLMKAKNQYSFAEKQELAAKSLYANLMAHFATLSEFKIASTDSAKSRELKLKNLANEIF